MADEIIVVSGCASGMGLATAELLRERGYEVIGVDIREAEVIVDLSTPAGRNDAIDEIRERSDGHLAGAVTFAGVSGFGGRAGSLVVSIDYFGAVDLLLGLRPFLASGTDAGAVAISSNAATTAPRIDQVLVDACLNGDELASKKRADAIGGPQAYAAAKFALARWVRRVAPAHDWIGSGISINAIVPGYVETPLVSEMRADPDGRSILDRLPLPIQRAGRPGEIATLAAFLLRPEARFIVGSLIFIDGGTDALIRPDDWPTIRATRNRQ